jgi:hypothetical protein
VEKVVRSGSELGGLKVVEAMPKREPRFAGGVLNHPLDEKRPDADLHMSFDAAISVFALGGSEIHAY